MAKFKQGAYIPKNPQKYVGDPTKIYYRSSWEKLVMLYMDLTTNVIKWSSEEITIPYVKPTDNKVHRYYPDFYCEMNINGVVKKYIIEVKPVKDTQLDTTKTKTQKSQKRLVESAITLATNEAKWKAAREWCQKNDITFMVWTENEIFGKKV